MSQPTSVPSRVTPDPIWDNPAREAATSPKSQTPPRSQATPRSAPPDPRRSAPDTPAGDNPRGLSDPDNLNNRYSRQILFPPVGQTGQTLLARAQVAIVGCGATGAAAAGLLARAGVGTLHLIDRDFVETSNLQRQSLFDEADAAEALPKAEAARRKIRLFNSSITVQAHVADLTPANIHNLLHPVSLILDGTDNFETRFLLNDYAVQQGKPWIYAAAIGAYAATMNILPRSLKIDLDKPPETHKTDLTALIGNSGENFSPNFASTACLACIFPVPPSGPVETCDTAGILATAVHLAASIQVTEALKLLTGQPHRMRRSLLSFDLWPDLDTTPFSRSEISTGTPNPECPVCAHRQFQHLNGASRPHITLCGRNSVQIHEHHRPLDLAAMHRRLSTLPEITDLRANSLLLRFRRGTHTLSLFADGRAIIQGTTDPVLARSLYARFIGI